MPSLKANGIEIAYELRGSGEPLLLLMGLGAPGSAWAPHSEAFEKLFQCVVMDNRGAGGSSKPKGPYSTAQMADDAAALLDGLGISRARVAGISLGSAIAQELALRHPEKVRSLLLVSSWARCDAYMKSLFESFALQRACLSPQAFAKALQLWIYSPAYYSAKRAELDEAAGKAGDSPMPFHAFEAQCRACSGHDALARLASVARPCLLCSGDADVFTPPGLSEEMLRRLPSARLEVFKGFGHCHHWEALERFNKIACEFLKEN